MADVTLTSAMRANLYSLQGTASLMSTIQGRLSTGKKVNSALDNPNNYFSAQSLTSRASDIGSLLDGMGQAIQTIKAANQGIESAKKVVDQMKAVASSALQNTSGSSASTGAIAMHVGSGVQINSLAEAGAVKLSDLVGSSGNALHDKGRVVAGDKLTITAGSTSVNVVATEGMTLNQLVTAVSNAGVTGFSASIGSDGKLSFANTSGAAVTLSGNLADKLGIATAKGAGSTATLAGATVSSSTKLRDIGIASSDLAATGTLTFNGADIDLSGLTADSTLADLAATIEASASTPAGMTVTVDGNKLKVVNNSDVAASFGGTSAAKFGFTTGNVAVDARTKGRAEGTKLAITDATQPTSLGSLGIVSHASSEGIKFTIGGVATTVTIDTTTNDNVSAILTALNTNPAFLATGTTAAFDAATQTIKFTGNTGAAITIENKASSTLATKLGIDGVVVSAKSNGGLMASSLSDPPVTTATKLSALGISSFSNSGSLTVNINGRATQVDMSGLNADSTVADLLTQINSALTAAGNAATVSLDVSNPSAPFLKFSGNDSDYAITFTGANAAALNLGGAFSVAPQNASVGDGNVKIANNTTTNAQTLFTYNTSSKVQSTATLASLNSYTSSSITTSDTLTVKLGSGPSTTITVGSGAGSVSTVSDLLKQLNSIGGVQASLDGNGKLTVSSSNGSDITLSGTLANKLGVGDPSDTQTGKTYNVSGTAPSSTYITQFETLRNQLNQLVADSSYQGVNLISGTGNSPLTVVFNEAATNANKLVINAVDLTTSGLGITAASGFWNSAANVESAISELTNAANTLRDTASSLGQNLATVQTRQDFANNMINTLKEGADSLTLADMNEESANMLALQTRQQLGIQSLSLASQANQAVMRLFG